MNRKPLMVAGLNKYLLLSILVSLLLISGCALFDFRDKKYPPEKRDSFGYRYSQELSHKKAYEAGYEDGFWDGKRVVMHEVSMTPRYWYEQGYEDGYSQGKQNCD